MPLVRQERERGTDPGCEMLLRGYLEALRPRIPCAQRLGITQNRGVQGV